MSKIRDLNWQLQSIQTQLRQIQEKVAVDLNQTDLSTAFNQLVTSFQTLERLLAVGSQQADSMWLDIAPDAIFVCDRDYRIAVWNQAAERLYGWTTAEAIGQVAPELLCGETPQVFPEMIATLMQQGGWKGTISQKTKTSQLVIVNSRWTLVQDESNQPQWLFAINTDVTEEKQLEVQFYRAQRLESLSRFASGIAHDLNNVLTPITVVSQLLRSQQPTLETRFQEMLQVLEDGTKRGVTLIKQLLMVARGKEGERMPVAIVALVEAVSEAVQQSLPNSIQIQRSLPTAAPWLVFADATCLHQVLMQLCLNARDAMPDGGILSVAVELCYVDQTVARLNLGAQVGTYVVVTVGDTGTGIAIEVRDRMFDPFFTTKPPGQGTGLGLATTLGIVKNYGGFLQVCSEVGQGTQIKMYLPLYEPKPDAAD